MLYGLTERQLARINNALRPANQGRDGQRPRTYEDHHWVRLSSTTASSGRYPGHFYTRDADGTMTQVDEVWVSFVNGTTPTGTTEYFYGRCSGFANGRPVFDVVDQSSVLDIPGLSEWTAWSVTSGSSGSTTSYLTSYIAMYDSTLNEHRKISWDKICQSYLIKNLAFDATPKTVSASDTELQTYIGKPDSAIQDWIFQDQFCAWAISTSSQDLYVQVNLDHSYLSAPVGGVADTDSFLIYDVSQNVWAKLSGSDLKTYIGSTSSDSTITITDGTTSQDVVSGDTITFTSGTGVDLTVSATDTVTADLDIAGLSTITFNSAEDYVPVLDGTDNSIKRTLLPSYSFTLNGDSGTQTVNGSDTVTIAGGSGILTAVTAPDTCTVNLDILNLTTSSAIESGDYIPIYDASVAGNRKIDATTVVTTNAGYLTEYTDWSIAATTNTVTLATFAAKTHVDKVLIRRKTAQSGVTEVTFTLTLESTGESSASYSPFDPLDASDSAHNVALTDFCGSYTNTTALKLTVNSTGGNLSLLSAGAIEVWAFYRTLPVPT